MNETPTTSTASTTTATTTATTTHSDPPTVERVQVTILGTGLAASLLAA